MKKPQWEASRGLPATLITAALATYNFDSNAESPFSLDRINNLIGHIQSSYASLFLQGNLDVNNLITVFTTIAIPIAAIYARRNRVKTKGRVPIDQYFISNDFANIPLNRPGYSDRTAYCMSELSDLVYWDMQPQESDIKGILNLLGDRLTDQSKSEILKLFSESDDAHYRQTRVDVERVLAKGGFTLIGEFNKEETQGFVCSRRGDNPYIVVVFRGTEKRFGDWKINANYHPMPIDGGKVHSGFYSAFSTIKVELENILKAEQKRFSEANNDIDNSKSTKVPIYFTGHSLGGALATIAAKEIAKIDEIVEDNYGACYTFGAPRIADYAYFELMKTPVYRVVNSADLVPRVPPGAVSTLAIYLIRFLKYLTSFSKPISQAIGASERLFTKLEDYRHHGDMRFLTDTLHESDTRPKLLANPNQMDVVQWFFRHTLVTFGMPIKSHSMQLYRNKLLRIAKHRMRKKEKVS